MHHRRRGTDALRPCVCAFLFPCVHVNTCQPVSVSVYTCLAACCLHLPATLLPTFPYILRVVWYPQSSSLPLPTWQLPPSLPLSCSLPLASTVPPVAPGSDGGRSNGSWSSVGGWSPKPPIARGVASTPGRQQGQGSADPGR